MSMDFWRRARIDGDCLIWTGAMTRDGYGHIKRGGFTQAHRYAYTLARGEIAEGMVIDHLCRNRACINPDHMEVVTRRTNTQRGERATKTHCVHGHPLSGANLYVWRTPSGASMRTCRACNREAQRRRYAKLREVTK